MKLEERSYHKSMRMKSDGKAVFIGLTKELSQWWGQMDTPVHKSGDVFTVSWSEAWYRFKVVEYVPYEKLTWACVDANQIIDGLEGVQKEWVGTELVWSVYQVGDREVEVHFEHRGLVPTFVCYKFCSATWDHFIGEALRKYIERQ